MRIAFYVNAIDKEFPRFTTTVLAREALSRGHDICYVTPDSFILRSDDSLTIRGIVLPGTKYKKEETFHKALQGRNTELVNFDCREIDVLLLRSDPSLDWGNQPWAVQAGVMFGRLAAERGVLVLNDPQGLSLAQNKLYLQGFPEVVRPQTIISKSIDEIRAFIAEQKQGVIVKPLQGSGGHNVFKVESAKDSNLNQIFEAVTEEGYLIAQSFIPEAGAGDIRLFVMNGEPLERDGKFAALRRVPAEGEVRSNMHAHGTPELVKVSNKVFELAAMVRPKLIQDGMFLVGLDVVGEKILEINVFTPGGLFSICELHETNFAATVIEAIERKAAIRKGYSTAIDNRQLATL